MTWHADQTEGRPTGNDKDMLLIERSVLVGRVQALQSTPLANKSQSALIGRTEDLLALAKKIKAIDKKLGRNVG